MDTRKLSSIGLFSTGILSLTIAIAPRFDAQINYRIGDRAGTVPQWLVPKGAEFRGLEPGYGALKFPAALLGTVLMAGSMHLARKYAAEEPVRRRIANCYQQQQEFTVAAQVAYEMALVQQRYKTLLEAEEVAFEGQVESAYIESIGGDPNQKALPGQSLDQVNNPGDKVQGEAEAAPAIPQSEKPPEVTTSQSNVAPDQPSETVGMTIIDGLVGSRRSLLLIGGTGAGKSITEMCLLSKFCERYPDAEVWVLAQKNDSFCGLDKKGRVTLFDSLDPAAALQVIDRIHKIYDQRRRLPEHARTELSPVRLLLADWLSINQALEEAAKDEPVKSSKYLTKLSDIIYNGRELNVCLWVDLQSFNLAAIGLKADANSRKNFNLVGLGNYSVDEFGSINESYGVLANMLSNRYMVADEDERTTLLAEFKRLKPTSKQHQRPIIFTTLEPARVALLPDLRHYKPGQRVKLEGYSRENLERIYRLEFELDKAPDSPVEQPDNPSETDNAGQPEALPEAVSGIVWSVRKVSDFYPESTPEQLFQSVGAALKTGASVRDVIKTVLKCREGERHATRSYRRHGKPLLRWLIQNYDDGAIANLPEIKKFLGGWKE